MSSEPRRDAMMKEHDIIEKCKAAFVSNVVKPEESKIKEPEDKKKWVSGLMMELYEFREDSSSQAYKDGCLFRPTSMEQLEFIKGAKNKFGHIQMKDKKRKRAVDAKFWIKEHAQLTDMREMVNTGLILKHDSILKPLLCDVLKPVLRGDDQPSKLAIACTKFDLPLQEWLHQEGAKAIPVGGYLSDLGKDFVRSGWTVIEYLWGMGYTCDHLDAPSTYVISGTTLKILPFFIRNRRPTENDDSMKLTLRQKFADLLDKHIAPLWNDLEFFELTGLMRDQNSSFELILGHPVLASPEERHLMYTISFFHDMPPDQLTALRNNISVDPDWAKKAKGLDLAFQDILSKNFDPDAVGALHFATVVACHYGQRLKDVDPKWNGKLAPDHVDKLLKGALPLLLCKRYAMKTHDAFKSKVIFQFVKWVWFYCNCL